MTPSLPPSKRAVLTEMRRLIQRWIVHKPFLWKQHSKAPFYWVYPRWRWVSWLLWATRDDFLRCAALSRREERRGK